MNFPDDFLSAVEDQLRKAVARANGENLDELHTMLAYHMGWQGEGAGAKATGKRIRPQLLLITCAAAGGNWQEALPAAAAVELLHNFSLIHDDIEDNSPLRRGRPTLWTKWGLPQALNAGDTLFTLAHWSILDLEATTSTGTALQAACILHGACLKLTQGQYLDISYESRPDLTLEAYWPMVSGKTAALLAACTELGALVAGVEQARQASFHDFGHDLGLAFQAQDDVLGVWGDAALTGKSTDSDLMTGKKSLPVLFGLGCNGPFAHRWRQGPVTPGEVADLARQLEAEGGRAYAQETADRLTRQALAHLEAAKPQGEAGDALRDLALKLVSRKS